MKTQLFKINGENKVAVWVEKQGDWQAHWEVDGIPFDGHRDMWSFSYQPETYLKESELSGDEWRKGGTIKYFRNDIQVYEQFCRKPSYAPQRILETLPKLMEVNWDKVCGGTKIYYDNTPAKIDHVMLDQGAFMVEVDGAERFPQTPYDREEDDDHEDPRRIKVDVLSPKIWWWRK